MGERREAKPELFVEELVKSAGKEALGVKLLAKVLAGLVGLTNKCRRLRQKNRPGGDNARQVSGLCGGDGWN